MHIELCLRSSTERYHFEDPSLSEKTILKWILKKYDMNIRTRLYQNSAQ
jgi:hypothetical protein